MILTRYQKYYRKNKQKFLDYNKKYRKANPDLVKQQKRDFYKRHRLKIREKARQRYKNDNEYRKHLFYKSKIYRRSDKGRFYDIKRAAQRRNLIFNLTLEEALKFKNKSCFYCGKKIIHIGIDRLNNKKGYVKRNMVSCCTICNRMKLAMSYKQFITQCKNILNWRNQTEEIPEIIT